MRLHIFAQGQTSTKMIAIIIVAFIALSVIVKRSMDYCCCRFIKNQITIIEGEKPDTSNFADSIGVTVKNKKLFNGAAIELNTQQEQPNGYFATYTFTIEKEGDYHIIFCGTPPGPIREGSPWYSPYALKIDDTPSIELYEKELNKEWPYVFKFNYIPGGYFFEKLTTVHLSEGQHTISITIDKRRKQDDRFTIYVDAFILIPSDVHPKTNIGKIPKALFTTLQDKEKDSQTTQLRYTGDTSM